MLSRILLASLVLAACSLAGCNPAGKLVGKWDADISGAAAEAEKAGNPMAALAAGMLSMFKLQAEFKADGTCSMNGSVFGKSIAAAGQWRYVKSEGDVLVLAIKMDKEAAEKEMRVKFLDNDTLEMAPPSGAGPGEQQLTFKRVKSG